MRRGRVRGAPAWCEEDRGSTTARQGFLSLSWSLELSLKPEPFPKVGKVIAQNLQKATILHTFGVQKGFRVLWVKGLEVRGGGLIELLRGPEGFVCP